MSVRVECPSGLTVVLRRFRVRDKNLLANKKVHRQGATTALLKAITESVEDPGPYAQNESGLVDWDSVIQGDRTVALVKNRIATWGDTMTAQRQCKNNRCGESVKMEYALSDLAVRPLPETSRPHVQDPSRPLQCKLPSGVVVSFKLTRGKDEKAMRKLKKQRSDDLATAFLQYRIVEVAGVNPSDLRSFLSDLDGRDDTALQEAFDEADCGIDTKVVFECEECGYEWNEDVELTEDFLFPSSTGKTSTTR